MSIWRNGAQDRSECQLTFRVGMYWPCDRERKDGNDGVGLNTGLVYAGRSVEELKGVEMGEGGVVTEVYLNPVVV